MVIHYKGGFKLLNYAFERLLRSANFNVSLQIPANLKSFLAILDVGCLLVYVIFL